RVKDGARARQHPQRPEVARVRGGVRTGEVHEDDLRGDYGAVPGDVVRTGVLVRIVAKVDDELVRADLDGHAVDSPAVLLLLERELALGQRGERVPRDPLPVLHEEAQGRGEPVDAVP